MKNLKLLLFLVSSLAILLGGWKNECQAGAKPLYKPGEILVKFKPVISKAQIGSNIASLNTISVKHFKSIGVHHLKLSSDLSVEDAIKIYSQDPDIEYIEPNYYLYINSTTPNDTHFSKLWGLHNTGQIVNGTAGTSDADIDLPEAWDITTGSDSVIVAVIDTGVDYNHPDLSGNIWSNTDEIANNGTDDDGNGYIDDIRGWDFADNDNNPQDSNNHGTHVAGTIAAVANNSTGTAGVVWSAKIMPLKAANSHGLLTTSDIISAINYAQANGAHIINASFGGYSDSQATKDAIDAFSGLFVAAAGNDGIDNDSTHHFPSDYTSSNIIAVAATDQSDSLAWFSNYGTTSVDVAAPGVNIYSTKLARQTVWNDNFDDGDMNDWATGGSNNDWGLSSYIYYSGAYSLSDSPAGNYQNDTSSWARSPTINLSSHSASRLEFQLRGISEANYDYLYVDVSTDGSKWTNLTVEIDGTIYDDGYSETTSVWLTASVDLGPYDGESTVYIRFRFVSDSSIVEDGWYIDDISITSASSSGTYQFLNGTSMAAPHVAGLAALIKASNLSLTTSQIKSIIEDNVDNISSLSSKVVTSGRINAYKSVPPNVPSGLSVTAISHKQINLTWTDNSGNERGFKIEQKTDAGGSYSQIATTSSNESSFSDTELSASTTYYYRVRAYNNTGDSSYTNETDATTQAAPSDGGGGSGGGCFIATAAFGSYIDPHVKVLRDFRDGYLLKSFEFRVSGYEFKIPNIPGKTFVKFYYKVSPPIADFIAEHALLRAITRVLLLPIVVIGVFMVKTTLIMKMVSLGLLMITISLLVLKRNKNI